MTEEQWQTLYQEGLVAFWIHSDDELRLLFIDLYQHRLSFRLSVARKNGNALVIVQLGR